VWEKTYNLDWACSFGKSIISADSNLIISCSKMDSSGPEDPWEYIYSTLTKVDRNGELLWDKFNKKFSVTRILFENQDKQYVTGNSFYRAHTADMIADFYLNVTRFENNSQILFDNIDTTTKQISRYWNSGVDIHLEEGGYLSAVEYIINDTTFAVNLKKYDEDGKFLSEDTLGFLNAGTYFKKMGSFTNILRKRYAGGFLISGLIYGTSNFYPYIGLILRFSNILKFEGCSLFSSNTNFSYRTLLELPNQDVVALGSGFDTIPLTFKNTIITFNRDGSRKKVNELLDLKSVQLSNLSYYQDHFYAIGEKKELIKDTIYWSFYIARYDTNFNKDWEKIWATDKNDKYITDILFDEKSKHFYVLGANNFKSYLAMFDLPVEVEEEIAFKSEKLFISPNPASDFLEISYSTNIDRRVNPTVDGIVIYNVFGTKFPPRLPSSATPQEGNLRFDVSGLPPGVYFVKVGDKVGKFVKI